MQPASSSLDAQWPDLVAVVSAAIDLEATARTSGALVRRREIRSAEALLRLALAYGPGGLSLRMAAAWAGISGLADLSDTAVMKRLRKAADWLGEVAGALLRRAAAAPPTQGPLPGRRLRIADGSMITGPGGKRKWRLHAAFDPVAGRFTDLALTDERGAESFDRTDWRAGDVGLGPPRHAPPPAPRRIPAAGGGFIVRTGWTRLPAGRGRGAGGVGADLRRAGGRRGRRAGGLGGLLRQGRQVARRRRVPGAPHRPPPRAGDGGAGGQGAAPPAEPVPLAPAAATAHCAGDRLLDAGHLAARRGAGVRGARGVSLALAGGTRLQAAQKPAGPGSAAGQERGPRPQLAARPPHSGLADRGHRQDAPGPSPLGRRTDAPPHSGASRRPCVTRSSPPCVACWASQRCSAQPPSSTAASGSG